MSEFNIIKEAAANCANSMDEVNDRIQKAKRHGGAHIIIKNTDTAGPSYWVPLSKADELLAELYLNES